MRSVFQNPAACFRLSPHLTPDDSPLRNSHSSERPYCFPSSPNGLNAQLHFHSSWLIRLSQLMAESRQSGLVYSDELLLPPLLSQGPGAAGHVTHRRLRETCAGQRCYITPTRPPAKVHKHPAASVHAREHFSALRRAGPGGGEGRRSSQQPVCYCSPSGADKPIRSVQASTCSKVYLLKRDLGFGELGLAGYRVEYLAGRHISLAAAARRGRKA
ncbi:hypothetical protein SKAU_G00122460 [Synaphobranchus kaupii]|uniref:Uncharacterized protein n=1 Tax=Synaphobranchus kaupii TaxID=118154 RepID=A0A9Q1FNU7_SYNKA|nr:hypothetical protein SKAU_G00122460 [Synaphobranchus kaupii]